MTENLAASSADSEALVEPTGNADVDAVLESLESIRETPVAEHLPIFEAAHERLRAALSEAGHDPSHAAAPTSP